MKKHKKLMEEIELGELGLIEKMIPVAEKAIPRVAKVIDDVNIGETAIEDVEKGKE
jgi:hypothetical protein